jgi:hypothetical protein
MNPRPPRAFGSTKSRGYVSGWLDRGEESAVSIKRQTERIIGEDILPAFETFGRRLGCDIQGIGYSGFWITEPGNPNLKWLFPEENATVHGTTKGTGIVKPF